MKLFQSTLLLLALLVFTACEKEIETLEQDAPAVQADGFPTSPCAQIQAQFTQPINVTNGQTVNNTFTIDGYSRTFRIYVPTNFNQSNPNKIYPVVFMFHGSGQQNTRLLQSTSWNQEAEDHDLIIVYPQAKSYDLNTNCPTQVENKTAWNTPGIQQQRVAGQYVHDDVKFVKAILRVEMDYAWKATFSCGGIGLQTLAPPDNGIYVPHWEIIGNRDMNARRRYLCPSWDKCCTPGNLDRDPNNWLQGPFGIPMIFLSAQCGVVPNSNNVRIIYQTNNNRSVLFVEDGPDIEYKLKMLPELDHEFPGPLYDASSSAAQAVDHTSRIWNWMSAF